MVRKILLSSFVTSAFLFSNLYAEETTNQNTPITSTQDEIATSQDIRPTSDEILPVSDENNGFVDVENSIKKMMEEVAKSIRDEKNGKFAYASDPVQISVSRDDPQYYDHLSAAYNEAFLKLKARLAYEKSGSFTAYAVLDEISNDLGDEGIERKLKDEIAAARAKDGFDDDIFRNILNKIMGGISEVKSKEIIQKAEHIKNSSSFKQNMGKVTFDYVEGLIPYENFIVKSSNGYDEVGLVAYVSPKSIELARALKKGYLTSPTQKKSQCKDPNELAANIKNPLSKLGLTFFYDDSCQPALISYAMKNYENKGKFAGRKEQNASQIAKMLAEKNIAMFLGASLSAKESANQVQNAIERVIKEVTSKDGKVLEERGGLEEINDIYTEYKNHMSESANMSLTGVKTIRNWNKTKGEQGVTGVMLYYSPMSIQQAKSNGVKPAIKQVPANTQKVIRSRNVEVEDF